MEAISFLREAGSVLCVSELRRGVKCHLLVYHFFSETTDRISKLHFCLAIIHCGVAYVADL